ncbi:hypothetical protein DSM106044_04638 [Robinsoniella peoriensis]|uniref:Uncharacterized protein n=1 Tax=Robinsoniella peoriensis TaxID=180332 RepID=A0A4U8Q2H4_9FIRM|nr:hypothetical protein DSM106044_04638 [Robinsoniella peoriensis]
MIIDDGLDVNTTEWLKSQVDVIRGPVEGEMV